MSGHQEDIPGHLIDRNSFWQNAKSPAGGPSAFQSAPPPGGTGGGNCPPAVSFQVDRSPPYNAAGGGRGYGPCLLPVARQGADGGDPGKSRAAPGAVHFTLDFPGRGTDLSRSFQARYFLYFRPVRSSPFSSWNFLSGEFLYSPSISLR